MATAPGRPGRTLIVLFVVVAALFGAMALTKTWSPKLGLDLRGGTTITLTARNSTNTGSVSQESLEQARTIIQNRVDSLGVGETEVTTAGDRQVVVSVPNVQQDELVRLVGQTAVLRFRAVYAAEPVAPPVTAPPTPDPSASAGAPSSAPSTAPSPSTSAPAPSATPTGNGRPAPALPTAPPAPTTPKPTEAGQGTPPETAINWQPSEADQSEFADYTCPEGENPLDVADQPLITCDTDKTEKLLLGPTLIEGKSLTEANAGIPQNNVAWVVNLTFDSAGATAFDKATGVLATRTAPQNRFAIVLDGESVSAPSLQSAIPGGQAEISGNFNQQSATQLANILKYGSLPLAFDVSEVNNVSATLGGEQLSAGITAGVIGLILVIVFCFLYYRGLGLVVVASLAIAALITYAAIVLLGGSVGFALNLPGIAGTIVAIGVTADSFVIYFERIRDEVRDGRSLRTAVETGWRRARQTVLIADSVSLLSALILFILAIGSVKGFAFTLGLTTVIDILVVFFFTKPLLSVLARTKFFGNGHKLSGLDPEHLGVQALPGSRPRKVAVARQATAVHGPAKEA